MAKTNQQRMLEEMIKDAQIRNSPMVADLEKDLETYKVRIGTDDQYLRIDPVLQRSV